MTPLQVARLALAHLSPEEAITAVAIAKAESNFNPQAVGDVHLTNDTWGPSYGLWQIRSLRDQWGTGRARDGSKLHVPEFNARSMAAIYHWRHDSWDPWSVYKSGAYKTHLAEARQAVRAALTETANLAKIRAYLNTHPGWRSLGVYNRRKIAGSNNWSQHAWGNAIDVGVLGTWTTGAPRGDGTSGQIAVDRIVADLEGKRRDGSLPVGLILWRRADHWDHAHVEAVPKQTGTPPILPTGESDEDMTELVEHIQRALVDAGYDLGDFGPDNDGVDGVWGARTQAAFTQAVKGGSPAEHSHEATVRLA